MADINSIETCYGGLSNHGLPQVAIWLMVFIGLRQIEMDSTYIKKQGILIVDDEEIILKLGQKMLSSITKKVFASNSAEGAIKILKDKIDKIDLAIIDVVLPNMEGTYLAQLMLDIKPDLKILFSSGYGSTEAMQAFLDDGRANFIPKPFTREEVVEKINSILSNVP